MSKQARSGRQMREGRREFFDSMKSSRGRIHQVINSHEKSPLRLGT
jgi:hypothetical protein